MKPTFRNRFAKLAAGLLTALSLSSAAFAQESLEERLQRLEKQNEEIRKQNETLMKLLNGGNAGSEVSAPGATPLNADDVRGIVTGYLQEKEAKQAKAAPAAIVADPDGRYRIGSDLRMSATWKNGIVFSTPNNDFSLHIGGWLQYDNVWWDQSNPLQIAKGSNAGKAQGVLSGTGLGGIGSLEDGTYFRRIRLQTDGKVWENYEYVLTLAMENNQFSTIGLDEFWVGATNIPLIGTVRLGHVKNAIGLEADMSASSKAMTFLERSSYSEAIERNENFVTGLWMGNNCLCERATWSSTIFRPDNGASSGTFFGNDQWAAQARLTALPIYELDGRHLMHVGLSGGWRSGVGGSTTRAVQLRARPEFRDDDPAGQGPVPAAAVAGGAQTVPNSNSNRMIDTGALLCNSDFVMGTEFLYILGPLSFQGEYGWNHMRDVSGQVGGATLKTPQSYTFSGGYLQLAYTITGENRSYDKRLGRLDSYYFGRQGNYNNFWFVRDDDGRLNLNTGAWELAARYSYVDLNSGSGSTAIVGGKMDGLTVGLNWYLNDNIKFQWDYVFDHRYDVPTGVNGGTTRGVGMRMQFMY